MLLLTLGQAAALSPSTFWTALDGILKNQPEQYWLSLMEAGVPLSEKYLKYLLPSEMK